MQYLRQTYEDCLYTTQSSTTDLVEHDGGALPWDTVLPVVVGGVHGGAAEHASDGAGLQEKGGEGSRGHSLPGRGCRLMQNRATKNSKRLVKFAHLTRGEEQTAL